MICVPDSVSRWLEPWWNTSCTSPLAGKHSTSKSTHALQGNGTPAARLRQGKRSRPAHSLLP